MARTKATELVRRFWELKVSTKAIYTEMDQILDELLKLGVAGQTFELGDGLRVGLVDNFAVKNKVFRPHGIQRYELAEVKA